MFPLSVDFNVTPAGDVGIGTTTPTTKLDVAGTLTLNPNTDQALNLRTGSIYKGNKLFIHTRSNGSGKGNTALGIQALESVLFGDRDTAIGYQALSSNTSGGQNTASGYQALFSNTSGGRNTASGCWALRFNVSGAKNTATGFSALGSNTMGYLNTASGSGALAANTIGNRNTASGVWALASNSTGFANTASGTYALMYNTYGFRNTANGYEALFLNTVGRNNTASGFRALFSNTTGLHNTASGYYSLLSNTVGSRNIAVGYSAGKSLTGDDNIAIGSTGMAGESGSIRMGSSVHTHTFVAGIRGTTTGMADGVPVLIDGAGQLGTVSSSRRFKEDIRDMGDASERLLDLRPVLFRYKEAFADGQKPIQYGLVAEEVAEVFPDLVVYDEGGKPLMVKYHLLSSMLLNELQKQSERDEAHDRELRALEARFEARFEERFEPLERAAALGHARPENALPSKGLSGNN